MIESIEVGLRKTLQFGFKFVTGAYRALPPFRAHDHTQHLRHAMFVPRIKRLHFEKKRPTTAIIKIIGTRLFILIFYVPTLTVVVLAVPLVRAGVVVGAVVVLFEVRLVTLLQQVLIPVR